MCDLSVDGFDSAGTLPFHVILQTNQSRAVNAHEECQ